MGQAGVLVFLVLHSAELFLNLKLSLPVSRMWHWWVSRSSNAVVILVSPNTWPHSPTPASSLNQITSASGKHAFRSDTFRSRQRLRALHPDNRKLARRVFDLLKHTEDLIGNPHHL